MVDVGGFASRGSALRRGLGTGGFSDDFWRRLSGQIEPEFGEQQPQFRLGLSVAGEHKFPAVGGRDVYIDHLHGGEFLQHAARGEAGRQGVQPPPERHVQGIGQEGDEDMRLDARFLLMKDRPDGEVALEAFECLFPATSCR